MPRLASAEASAAERRMMVDCQLRTFEITDRAVLAAFDTVPREAFAAPASVAFAYADRDVPALGRTRRLMVAPMPLARMIQALRLAPGARALDVAGGAGYGAALLRELGASVTALETEWDAGAANRLAGAAAARVECVSGALPAGWAANAPYDAILVHGSLEREPEALIGQLRDGGRLACGEVNGDCGRLVCYERLASGFRKRAIVDARLPPLLEFALEPVFVF